MSYHLTASLEDYLEAIAELTAAEGHAHTKEIAKKLNVKMPSVTGGLYKFANLSYVALFKLLRWSNVFVFCHWEIA